MTLMKWIEVFLSITAFVCQAGNSLTEHLRNEHLVVIGRDSNGISKMWITPKISAPSQVAVTVPIGPDHAISSAFSEQSSRSRELTVESSYSSGSTSLHHVFVPLENGVLNVTFMYNGSAAQDIGTENETQITVIQPHILYRFGNPCPHMCASLGVYKTESLYTLCASSSGVCRCKLAQINQQNSTVFLSSRECHLLLNPSTNIVVEQISDIVRYLPSRIGLHLLFASNNHIYQDDVIDGTNVEPIQFSNSANCQVLLRLQKISESKLLIYCANNTMVEYNFDSARASQSNNHLYFPCSATANFSVSVNLTNNGHADIRYNYRVDGRSFSQLQATSRQFKFGECIEYRDHHLFLYTDCSNNLHLINSSMRAPLVYNISISNQHARPLIINERYIVTHSLDHQTSSVFDLDIQNIHSPIITQQDHNNIIALLQLATVVSNLSTVIEIEPTRTPIASSAVMVLSPTPHSSSIATSAPTSVMSTAVTYDMNTSPTHVNDPEDFIGPLIAIAVIVVIIIIGLSVGGTIGCIQCYRRRKSTPPPPIDSQSSTGRYERSVLPTGAGIAISNLRRERDSASCTSNSMSQLHSSRNTSGSEILSPDAATPSSGSPLSGSSRHSSSSPLCDSQGQESNIIVQPIAETNFNEARSNATQPVVPHR